MKNKGSKKENISISPGLVKSKGALAPQVNKIKMEKVEKTPKSEKKAKSIKTPKVEETSKIDEAKKTPLAKKVIKVDETPKAVKANKVEKTPKVDKANKVEKTPKSETSSKANKTPKVDKANKVEKTPESETSSKANKTPKVDKANKVEKTPKDDMANKVDKTPKSEKPSNADETAKSEKVAKISKTGKTPKIDQAEKVSKEEKIEKSIIIDAPQRQNGISEKKALLDRKQVTPFVEALFKLNEKKLVKNSKKDSKEKLFDDDESERINLMIGSIKLPSDKRKHVVKIQLPHGLLPDPSDVCLIVKDLQKGLKVDHEPTANHFRELLADKGVGPELVSTVLPLRELKVEYKQYETKTALCHRHDAFLVDDRVVKFVPMFLGKPFYKRKKIPIPVNLRAKNLKNVIETALTTTSLPLGHKGSSSMVQIGHVGMTKSQVVDNLMKVIETLGERFPGGHKNIRTLHLKTDSSMAIPMHISTTPVNEIGYVDAMKPLPKAKEELSDELSTQPGMEVTVRPDGSIKIKKKVDPNWDDTRDENLSEESDEDEDVSDAEDGEKKEEEAKLEQKDKKNKAKKRPVESSEKQVNGKKKKKAEKVEEESDDEEMDAAEQKYLKKQQETETKTEKKEGKVEKKKKEEVKKIESESEEDDEEDFPSSEEEEEKFDDDQDVDEVIEDSGDEDEQDDEDDEDDDEDKELVLKNQPQTLEEDSDDASGKQKRVKKSKKERRMDAKRQKAEGIVKKSKKGKKK